MIELLIQKKADADRENSRGKTPLTIALECQNKEVEKLLRKLGAQKQTIVEHEIEQIDCVTMSLFVLFLAGAGFGCFWYVAT